MATAVVNDNFTTINACEAYGDWSGSTPADEADDYKQGTQCVGFKMWGSGDNDSEISVTENLSLDPHVRFWFKHAVVAKLNTLSNGGIQLYASDGTNTGYWYLDGYSADSSDGLYKGGWKCFVVDTGRACDSGTKPTMTTITLMGLRVNLTSNAKNAVNCYIDMVRRGDGIQIQGGLTGDRLTMADIEAVSNNTTNAHGVISKIGKLYVLSGEVTFGATDSSNCYFSDDGVVLFFEDRPVAVSLYKIDFEQGEGITECQFGSISSGLTTGGCFFSVDDGAHYGTTLYFRMRMLDNDVTAMNLYGCIINTKAGQIRFGTSTLELTVPEIHLNNTTFEGCAEILFNVSNSSNDFTGVTFANGTVTGDNLTLYELHTNGFIDTKFLDNYRGFSIKKTGTFNFTRALFSGNASCDVYIGNSTGSMTVNLIDSSPDDPVISDLGGLVTYTVNENTSYNLKVTNESGTGLDGVGVRMARSNGVQAFAVLTAATGEIVEQLVTRRTQGKSSGSGFSSTFNPFSLRIRKYDYVPVDISKTLATKGVNDVFPLNDDDVATADESTVSGYTGITINESPTPKVIELTANHSLLEVYEYLQYYVAQTTNLDLEVPLSSLDGVTFTNGNFDFDVNGVTLSGSTLILYMPTKDFTLTSGGQQGLKKLTDIDGTQVVLVLQNVEAGSQCYIEDENEVELMNKLATGSGKVEVTEPYVHTVDKDLVIRVRKSSAAPKKKFFVSGGTVTSDGYTGYVIQEEDPFA